MGVLLNLLNSILIMLSCIAILVVSFVVLYIFTPLGKYLYKKYPKIFFSQDEARINIDWKEKEE
jgi:hypothetical protein